MDVISLRRSALRASIDSSWRLTIFSVTALFAACSTEHTADPQLAGIVASLLCNGEGHHPLSDGLPPVGPMSSMGLHGYMCDTVSDVDEFPFPMTAREYRSDPQTWSQRIREEVGRQHNHPGPETVIVYGAFRLVAV